MTKRRIQLDLEENDWLAVMNWAGVPVEGRTPRQTNEDFTRAVAKAAGINILTRRDRDRIAAKERRIAALQAEVESLNRGTAPAPKRPVLGNAESETLPQALPPLEEENTSAALPPLSSFTTEEAEPTREQLWEKLKQEYMSYAHNETLQARAKAALTEHHIGKDTITSEKLSAFIATMREAQ